MKLLNISLKAVLWITLILLPLALALASVLTAAEGEVSDYGILSIFLFFINPLYVTLVSYYFINKKSVAFMYPFLVLPWFLLCLPYLTRTNDDWLMIAEIELHMGLYQIIGITVFFTLACLVKYFVFRNRVSGCIKIIAKKHISTEIIQIIKWVMLCFIVPILLQFVIFIIGLVIHISEISLTLIYIYTLAEPIYLALVSYRFASKIKAFYMYFGLIIMQFIRFVFSAIDSDSETFSGGVIISIYRIIAITIFFSIACFIKHIVCRRKAKNSLGDALPEDSTGEKTV